MARALILVHYLQLLAVMDPAGEEADKIRKIIHHSDFGEISDGEEEDDYKPVNAFSRTKGDERKLSKRKYEL